MDIPDLHDWTLISINLDFSSNAANMLVKGPNANARIIYNNMNDLKVSNYSPWGESKSINSCVVKNIGEIKSIEIEMQSGDMIYVVAEAAYFVSEGG